jgi:hypothetical protein
MLSHLLYNSDLIRIQNGSFAIEPLSKTSLRKILAWGTANGTIHNGNFISFDFGDIT